MSIRLLVVSDVGQSHLVTPSDCIHLKVRDHTNRNRLVGSDKVTRALGLHEFSEEQRKTLETLP
jgi:hypothetical protein